MIYELAADEFLLVERLFQGPLQYIPALSVVYQQYPGRVFVDDRENSRVAIVWALGRWAYIEGEGFSERFTELLGDFIRRVVIPDSQLLNMDWFELYVPDSGDWETAVAHHLSGFDSSMHFESVFAWDEAAYEGFRSDYTFPPDASTAKADLPILSEKVRSSRSISDELKLKTAIGFRVFSDGVPVAQCRSNGFSLGSRFMIDVVTFDTIRRGKGYATAAAVALLDYCRKNGLIPLWETTEDNAASRRLAEKLGFVEVESYPVFAIEF